jgi:hypothetical protein
MIYLVQCYTVLPYVLLHIASIIFHYLMMQATSGRWCTLILASSPLTFLSLLLVVVGRHTLHPVGSLLLQHRHLPCFPFTMHQRQLNPTPFLPLEQVPEHPRSSTQLAGLLVLHLIDRSTIAPSLHHCRVPLSVSYHASACPSSVRCAQLRLTQPLSSGTRRELFPTSTPAVVVERRRTAGKICLPHHHSTPVHR